MRCSVNLWTAAVAFAWLGSALALELYKTSFAGPSPVWSSKVMVEHAHHLCQSFRNVCGKDLVDPSLLEDPAEAARQLFSLPTTVVLSHGLQDGPEGPILNYGNEAALSQFGATWEQLTTLPSTYTAEAGNREARARLLERVLQDGYVDDYCGVRIALDQRRFRIEQAYVWNVMVDGVRLGQAACFELPVTEL
jgi:hypothetical protein